MQLDPIVIDNLNLSKDKLEQEAKKIRAEITSLETEKNEKIKKLFDEYNKKKEEIDLLYQETLLVVRNNFRDIQININNINRAICTLTRDSSKKETEKKISSEAIHDAIIIYLYQNQDGANKQKIANLLESKGYLDPNKNKNIVLGSILSNMQRIGLINCCKNDTYILANQQEASQRIKIRSLILKSLKESSDGLCIEDIEQRIIKTGLLNVSDKRRIRGMLLGMSQGQYVTRVNVNNREIFRAN
jgi:hypothetical protein